MAPNEYLGEITVFEKSDGPLTKRIALVDGKIVNDSSACRMANGFARRVKIDTMQVLADLINTFTASEAYALGRLTDGLPDRVRVVRRDKLNGAGDPFVIARTKDYVVFKEGEPGFDLLDVDCKGMPETVERLLNECGGVLGALCRVLPALKTVARVERASTSSGLRNRDTGETIPGSGGLHIVIPVLDAADIPRFLSDLHDRLWLAGFGWGIVSAAGSFLERSLIDKSVGSPERLIFEGPPIIEPPLEQEGRNAVAHDGFVLDTRLCPPLTNGEKARVLELKDTEKHRLAPQLKAAREAWSAEYIKRLTASGKTKAEARALIDRWIDRQELSGAFPLPFDDQKIAGTTVADVLAAPDKYINETLSDPFEGPAYGRGKAIIFQHRNGSLFINSFAHGGIKYELKDERDAEVERLAKLSALQYEQDREAAAEKLNVRVTVLDDLVDAVREKLDPDADPDPGQRRKTADILIELSARAEELFHAPDGTAYATIPIGDHFETWPIRSKGFRRWLAREFFTETTSAPNSDAIQSALNIIEARAAFDGPQRLVYVRIGAHDGRIYLDLADEKWRAVEISSTGWQIVNHPPVRFRRAAGMLPLSEPVHGGKIEELRRFLNVGDSSNDFVLTVSFILAVLRERGPYPVLNLSGEHGAAKSTFAAVLRKLIDPNSAALRALPREDRDLFIAANNAHLLAFDNISKMPDWISDTLCRLATGGGFATRQLYSDQDEALFDAMRPIILNGIEDIISRPDLADRAIFLNLKNITEDKRKSELSFWADFERAHPRILGAVLDGVAHGLRQLPNTSLKATPRMADFALWATACEQAFWKGGTFGRAYEQNRDDAIDTVIEADLVATAVQEFMAERTGWQGTSSDLLGALKMAVGEDQTKLKEWPTSPRSLSGRLRRVAASLRRAGIDITFGEKSPDRKRNRLIGLLARKDGGGDRPNRPDRPDRPDRPNSQPVNEMGADGRSDGRDDEALVTVRPNTSENKPSDGVDGSDANFPMDTGGDSEPGLSPYTIRDLANGYIEEAARRRDDSDLAAVGALGKALDGRLRQRLAELGVSPEFIEVEMERVMQTVFAVPP
jgi:hypothetical protein